MHPDAPRLFALDESLRAEADRVLAESGIGGILAEAGYMTVGSYSMRTMARRDLDFDRAEESPDWDWHWDIGSRLAKTGWCVRLLCVDHHREGWYGPGLYWGLRAVDPERAEPARRGDPTVWKLDLWSIPPADFERNARRREAWMSLMTEEARSHILAIKEGDTEYGRSIISVHVYEAVLEHGIRGTEAFRKWWELRYPGREKA